MRPTSASPAPLLGAAKKARPIAITTPTPARLIVIDRALSLLKEGGHYQVLFEIHLPTRYQPMLRPLITIGVIDIMNIVLL